MDNFFKHSFPENIKKELDQIQELIMPLAKKTSKYMFWTFPLIGVALINLVYLLFFSNQTDGMYRSLGEYSLIGAIGLALLKETRLNKKEIERIGVRYIIDRMKKSRYVTTERKNQYIRRVRQNPVRAMDHFIRFLQEEERLKRLSMYGD